VIIDSRYHMASLVAVFLALGIGIIIGSVMVGDSFVKNIINEQEYIVKRLELDYENLKKEAKLSREEINNLRRTVDLYQRYAHDSFPYVVKGRLEGKKVAVFENAEAKTPQYLLENLKLSGAEVLCYFDISDYVSGAEKETTAIIINNQYFNEIAANAQESELSLIGQLEKMGTKYFIVETLFNDKVSGNKAPERQEGIYYINSADSIPEQAALIFAIAGLTEQKKEQQRPALRFD